MTKMTDRFEQFVSGITLCYKHIQRIKSLEMTELGLKGTQAMCVFYLYRKPEGLTAAQLSQLCLEDKAAVSRTLAHLAEGGYLEQAEEGSKRYRAHIILSQKGRELGEKVNELIAEWVEMGGEGLSAEERAAFYHGLEVISRNLQERYSGKAL